MHTSPAVCLRGHPVPPDVPFAECALCLIRVAASVPEEIHGYEILGPLGEGAHGTVYHALQPGAGKEVALKVIRSDCFESEIRSHVQLKHDHIVEIHDARGLEHDPPYFAMEYMAGGTLAAFKWRQRFHEPAQAMALLVQVADAVQFAHEHLILHRDLKPSNILLDAKGVPHVSDFSVAKPLDCTESTLTATIAGTVPYMSPEQAGAIDQPVSTASDVYGLGAVLYDLLAGRPPRPVQGLSELQDSFRDNPAPPPIANPEVDADLEAVCLRALSVDLEARYSTPRQLTDDLRRLIEGDWLPWRPPTLWQRLRRLLGQNRLVSGTILAGALLLGVTNWFTFDRVRRQQAELEQLVLRANAALAKAQAQAALAELTSYRDATARAVRQHADLLERVLQSPASSDGLAELGFEIPGCDSVFVTGCDGVTRAHSFTEPMRKRYPNGPPSYLGTNYLFRDYYRAAMQLGKRGAREVYVSRAFRSTWDSRFKFGFSTPVYASEGSPIRPCFPNSRVVGVLLASRPASPTLGAVQIPELEGSGQRTALYGPRDRDDAGLPIPPASALHVIVHEGLALGDERRLDTRLAGRLTAQFGPAAPPGQQFQAAHARPHMDDDYEDPLANAEARWLGGFYPVGRTGYFVGVETPYGRAVRPARLSATLPALNLGFFAYTVCAGWIIWWRRARRAGRHA